MRQFALLAALAGILVAAPARAQLPDVTVPEVEVPLPDAPDIEPLEPAAPSGDGGGESGGPLPAPGTTSSGGGSTGGAGSDADGSGSAEGSGSGTRSGGGGSSRAQVCPCAAPATGNPVAGDYDKCPRDDASPGGAAVLAAQRSEAPPADPDGAGGEASATARGDGPAPGDGPAREAAPQAAAGETDPVAWVVLAAMALCLLAALAGGLRALHGRLSG